MVQLPVEYLEESFQRVEIPLAITCQEITE